MGAEFSPGAQRVVNLLVAVVLTVAILRLGREILLPLAMASLLTFLLSPLVIALERRKLPRIPAVLFVIAILFCALLVGGWSVTLQFNDLARKLPTYKANLHAKLESVRLSEGFLRRFQETMDEVGDLKPGSEHVQPVRVVTSQTLPYEELKFVFFAVMTPLADAAFVLVLVIFMLISREDIRNRLVRLAGTRFALTTRTLDEVGSRISRYLLMNALVNGGLGIAVAIGLALVGVDYAIMWGCLAAVLRFIPYIGPILASVMPVTLAAIQFPGTDWIHPILAATVFIVLELIANNIVEPLAYGSSTGVSTVALLVAAMFWTWVWGPLGLVLAVPLTVVFAVLGEYVAPLEPLAILLGDKPPLDRWITYYQRLLARDTDEAASILLESRQGHAPIEVYDRVIIPALVVAQKDRESGELLDAEQQFVWQATKEFMEDWDPDKESSKAPGDASTAAPERIAIKAHIVGCPAHDAGDEMALEMLRQSVTLDSDGRFDVLPSTMLASEMLSSISRQPPDAVCISSLGVLGGSQTRYLCKRIRQSFPELQILVGRWGFTGDRDEMTANLKQRGADQVLASLLEARDVLQRVTPLRSEKQQPADALATPCSS